MDLDNTPLDQIFTRVSSPVLERIILLAQKELERRKKSGDILIYHFIIYICYTIIMIALLGLMLRSTPPGVKFRNEGQFWFDINFPYIWYANCVLLLFLFKGMSSSKYTYLCYKKLRLVCINMLQARCRYTVLVMFITSLAKMLLLRSHPDIINPGPDKTLNLVYCNVNGLIKMHTIGGDQPEFQVSKLRDLKGYLFTYSPDIVVLNETWLNKYISEGELISDKYYSIFRKDRTEKDMKTFGKKGGGGVLILCKNNIGVDTEIVKAKTDLPIVTILLKHKNITPLCISTFYRYDYSGLEHFKEAERYYTNLAKKFKNLTIIGDLNLSSVDNWDVPVSNNSTHESFINLFSSLGLKSLVNIPTHRDGNILDLLLTNIDTSYNNVMLEENSLVKSDHLTLKCEIKFKKSRPKYKNCKKFSYRKADWDSLNKELLGIDWLAQFKDLSAEQSLQIFKSRLDIALRHNVPLVSVKIGSQPPWYDEELRQLKKSFDNSRKNFLKNKDSIVAKEEYELKEHQYRALAIEKEISFLELSSIDEHTPNANVSKKFFKHVKSKTNSTRIPETVHFNNNFSSVSHRKCEMFNEFFCNQFTESSTYQETVDMDRDHTTDFNSEKFRYDEILKILKKLDVSKATGPDNIDGVVLRKCHKSLAYPLTLIFNKSYSEGCIPTEWKTANVVPVHKKGDRSCVENYRPISLTCLIMKVFEKLIRERLYKASLDKITPYQHGFVPFKSCTSQLIEFNCELALNINNRYQTDIVYFDFQKAFDSVSHDVIIRKLKNEFNLEGKMLRFLINYLSGRQQRVVLDGDFSEWVEVRSGVPQGSILGPFLFVLFINDIVNVVRDDDITKIRLYADDLKIWRIINSDEDSLQPDIDRLVQWANDNKMIFHPNKCKLLRCTKNINRRQLNYHLDRNEIKLCENEIDLGVSTNYKLSPIEHQKNVVSKASQRLGLVKRVGVLVTCPLKKKNLYISLVRSLFEHCSQIWRPVSDSSLLKFESLQKRATKWIFGETDTSYSLETYVKKLREIDVLPMTQKFQYNDLKLFHKIFYETSPIKFPSFLQKYHPESHDRRTTRQQTKRDRTNIICTEQPRVDLFKNSYFYRCHLEWNLLPQELRKTTEHNLFSSKLKDHLWNALHDTS